MINTELHAAGISDERLRESYRYCRRLNAEHGRTYFLATRLLAPSQRPAVHALYGFARYADDILDVVTPADWARQGMTAGTPFALAHTFSQTGPFRPANLVRGVDNAVLAGGSTVPGVGVPTALISGRLAAERITGPVDPPRKTVIYPDKKQVRA